MAEKEIIDFSDYTPGKVVFADWYDIIYEFSLPLSAMLILAILVLYTLLKTPSKFYIKFFTIPLIFFLFYSTIVKLNNILGYAYPTYPVGKVILHDGNRSGDVIEIWVQHLGETETRLYRIPYTQEMQEEVKRGKEAKQKGNPTVIEFTQGKLKRGQQGQTREGAEYKTFKLKELMNKQFKKDYEKDD